jgi:hypothetical protein
MKLITIVALITVLISALQLEAAQAIYKSIGRQTVIGNNQVRSVTVKGFSIFDPDSNRGTAIGAFTVDNRKLFTVVPLQNYRIEHVSGANGATYTVMAKAENPGTQFAGLILESVYLRGRDSEVTIDSHGTRSLPRTFTCSARIIAKNAQNGVTLAGEVTGSYTLDIRASQSSSSSETFDEAVARLTNSFISQGYTQFTAPAP